MLPDLPSPPLVGIVVLNFHQPTATIVCISSLLAREPATTRILWVENDAGRSWAATSEALQSAPFPWQELDPSNLELPAAGVVGVLRNAGNLGYGAGNNTGLRRLHRAGIPYAWVLNNDTELIEGSSADLVAAAQALPDAGSWGTTILEGAAAYTGGALSRKDFASRPVAGAETLEADPDSYVSGCSLFLPLALAAEAGFIPEDYFLYYEDAAFGLELRRRGHPPGAVPSVSIRHAGSLSGGQRSNLVEYYNRRNRWALIQRYYPEAMAGQRLRRFHLWQKWILRGRFDRIRIELAAYADFQAARMGRTIRRF
ncbi:MAG TPA: glycosyltransferase family 2 protein [Holophagaceae bacterium]|nr:glycosyltransferase family 2 protein [Holophagaceae bacterium]